MGGGGSGQPRIEKAVRSHLQTQCSHAGECGAPKTCLNTFYQVLVKYAHLFVLTLPCTNTPSPSCIPSVSLAFCRNSSMYMQSWGGNNIFAHVVVYGWTGIPAACAHHPSHPQRPSLAGPLLWSSGCHNLHCRCTHAAAGEAQSSSVILGQHSDLERISIECQNCKIVCGCHWHQFEQILMLRDVKCTGPSCGRIHIWTTSSDGLRWMDCGTMCSGAYKSLRSIPES